MKRIILSVAVLLGTATMTFAQVSTGSTQKTQTPPPAGQVVKQQAQDTFKEIKPDALNENVKKAINAYTTTFNVTKLEYNEAKKLTKVTLSNKETKAIEVVILDDAGKKVE